MTVCRILENCKNVFSFLCYLMTLNVRNYLKLLYVLFHFEALPDLTFQFRIECLRLLDETSVHLCVFISHDNGHKSSFNYLSVTFIAPYDTLHWPCNTKVLCNQLWVSTLLTNKIVHFQTHFVQFIPQQRAIKLIERKCAVT